ncbi:Bcr/CflA family efflux MFS transporter [Aquabacterium sp.]|uniref:Bcr/CflA family efflux MFS transporter n=1 Tax=Aquabacterium sp. TaxID=1872578 RepID=UPI002B6AD099|nr:Bcr/CflA family efflux MFS transporter [Aquabacterium sp.]HSW08671.1 Bcr/CflA family efflux MFS transporter [Aquabacterium sp.]
MPATASAPRPSPLLAAFVLALLLGMQPVSTDLMLPALPLLAADLNAGMAPAQLTMSALILAFGIAQLVWGPLADRFGRRPILLSGLALYGLASVGAALAGDVMQVVGWRIVQGAALSVPVVCARAMVRDLYEPHEGALVMAKALSGLGLIAIGSPLLGGVLAAAFGWRAVLAAMALAGALMGGFLFLRWPETIRQRRPDATRLKPLLAQTAQVLRHPGFRAWALLVTCTYGGLFVFLAGAGFVLIRVLGLTPLHAGAVMSTTSIAYIAGTFVCRHWLPRHGLAGTAVRGAGFTLVACVLMSALAITDARSVWAVMLPTWVYSLGHGVHQPCGQAGAVGPFPHAAGQASALAGFVLAVGAFAVGLWLGHALDGTVRPLASGMAVAAALTVLVAWTLVRRDGEPVRKPSLKPA